jgi:TonB-linked SusC/RagA family outer membrane protein
MRQKIDCLAVRLCAAVFFMFIAATAFAQKTVTGSVTSAKDNQPINGASILVKGTNVGTASSPTGIFSINVPAGKKILVISSIGYDDQEIDVSSQSTITVSLKEKTSSLDEIVVTGYTAQKKKEITGAVSVVNVKDMKQVPAGTGEEALQGRASGLTVITSGQPGAASDLRIRGVTTFGNNQPLIIVDGVQGDLHNLNVNDIESIQVLKDASAAIYGVRGANGVIIVTTKKGKTGKARVTYDGYYGITTPGPGFDMANTQQEADAIWQQRINSGLQPGDEGWGSKQYGTGVEPVIPDYITPTGASAGDPNTDPSTYNKASNQITLANKAGTNWYDEITRQATTQSHNIAVSSGSDKSSYYFSFGYLNQQGIAEFQYLKRYSLRANTQFHVGNKIRIGENLYVLYQQNPTYGNQGEGSPFSVAFREDAIIPVYDIMGNFAGTKSQDLGNAQNPYANIYRTKDNRGNKWDISGNVYAEVDLLKHLTFRSSFGGLVDNNYSYNFNYVAYENAEGNTGSNSFTENASFNYNWTWTNSVTYNNTFGNHNVKVLLGTEALDYYGRGLTATRSNYFSENPDYWVLGAGSGNQSNDGYAYRSSLWSQFAKLEYGFEGKYLINASIRRDGSSVFAEDVRYGYFPAVSAAWRISQENFMKGVSFINDLKLRGSWGRLGTAGDVPATNPYNLYQTRAGRSAYDISGTSTTPYAGFFRSNLGNPGTSWEEDEITNIGIDATLFKNKIDLSVEWYRKKIDGLLYGAQGPAFDVVEIGDPALPQTNAASNQNTGVDLSLTYHANIAKDLKLDLTGIFTSYNNEILDIPGSKYFDGYNIRNVVIQRNEVGHPLGAFYGYEVIGLFQSQEDIDKSPKQLADGSGARIGNFKYRDVNGDGLIDVNDRTYIGNPHPDFTYGLNLALSYKSFDFSAFFFGSAGNDIYNQTLYYTDFPDFFKGGIRREVAVNSWTPENTNTNIPALYNTGNFGSDQSTSSYFISKGSYFRCKQMQIGYNLPGNLLSKYGIEHLRIYVQGANLFTITDYEGLDPELQSITNPNDPASSRGAFNLGIDQGNYPHTPAYLFGINLSF